MPCIAPSRLPAIAPVESESPSWFTARITPCLKLRATCDRTLQGYEGLIAAQQCLPNNEVRDNFAAEYSVLNKIWEALSPDTVLGPCEKDYKWLSQVCQSVQPSSGHGKLIIPWAPRRSS